MTVKTNKMQEIFNNIESQVQHNANQGNSTSDRHWTEEVGVLLTVEDARELVDIVKGLVIKKYKISYRYLASCMEGMDARALVDIANGSRRNWTEEVGVLLTVEDARALVDRINENDVAPEEIIEAESKDKANFIFRQKHWPLFKKAGLSNLTVQGFERFSELDHHIKNWGMSITEI